MVNLDPPSFDVLSAARAVSLLPGADTRFAAFSGHEAVLRQAPVLTELARQCGLEGCLDHLRFFHSNPYFGGKQPYLLLLQGHAGPFAAVLMYEYRVAGLPLRLFIPSDAGGERTVIAPPDQRAAVAYQAAGFLLQQRALVVMLSFGCDGTEDFASAIAAHRSVSRALRTRTQLRDLPLEPTLDLTLARMGAHTRRNLRAARRRADEAGLRYRDAAHITDDDFLRLNEQSAYPVPPHVALWRLRSARQEPGGFMTGLVEPEGRWACLAGGRRYRGPGGLMTAIDWQMNRLDLGRLSLGTTLRAYLLEGEIGGGSSRLRFEGGTPHSMHSAFLPESVADLVFAQPWMSAAMVRALGKRLRAGNLLGETLVADDLRWL